MNCKEPSTTYSSTRLLANANMACKGSRKLNCVHPLRQLNITRFLQGSVFHKAPIPAATNYRLFAALTLRFSLSEVLFNSVHMFLVGDNYYFTRMEMLHLRPSVLNSSRSCLFSRNAMANLEEQATLRTTGTIVLKRQTCRHKDPQGHMTRPLL